MRKTSGRLTAALGATLLIAGGSLTATPALAAAPASAIAPAASTSGVSTATGLSASEGFLMLVAVRPTKVTVPSNYVYDPKLGPRHDYCTDAPDEFPAPRAANADFRGPCARHDLCYAGSTDQFVCDNALRKDMYTNCTYYYSSFSVLRPLCKATADIYWAAVVIT
jgi:hypothetical protein